MARDLALFLSIYLVWMIYIFIELILNFSIVMKKKILKFTALIGLIIFALCADMSADNTDDSACPDDGGVVITCGRYEGACWALDWISPIIYIHCYFSRKKKDHCIPD